MHDQTSRATPALPQLEDALLWCMRAWVIGYTNQKTVSDRIEAVFGRLGANAGAADLDGFMWALCHGARRTLEINCVCCNDISDDERLLLDTFALQQQEDHEDAYAVLNALVNERIATLACERAQRLTLRLVAAGQVLAGPSPDCARLLGHSAGVSASRYLH